LDVVDTTRRRCAADIVAAWAGIDSDALEAVPDDIVAALAMRIVDGQGPVGVLKDELMEHMRSAVGRLHEAAHTDSLTGLANRRAAESRLADELERARRYGPPVSVLMVDVDGLKAVNDEFGHAVGDDVLREVAARLANSVRRLDMVSRWGGDEFLVICPGSDHEAALQVGAKLLRSCRRTSVRAGRAARQVSVSIGVAVSVEPAQRSAPSRRVGRREAAEVGRLLSTADSALYRAKRAGRGRVAG
jgi:diguanylate cyclase (GGDEF)-like protein